MKADYLLKFPIWLIGAILYGLSWPMPWSANLSFLAWFAFVFLFISLKKTKTFWGFWGTVWVFSFIAHTICSGWFLDIPTNKILIIIGAINESLIFPFIFLPFYFIKKKAGFDKTIFVLPFLFVTGEWIYCSLEHNLGYLRVVHSQTANPWLIQYIDLFGSFAVTFWVILFNVLIYRALEKNRYRLISGSFIKRMAVIALVMISLPLVYARYRDQQLKQVKADSISIAMVHTLFPPNPEKSEQELKNLDRTVELADSVDYYSKNRIDRPDLYVWHEGAIPSGNTMSIQRFVQSAVNDWQRPLISGMEHFEKFAGTEAWQRVNRVVLFTPDPDSAAALQCYDKISLAPGWESLPYLSLLHSLGIFLPAEHKFHKKGTEMRLLEVPAGSSRIRVGTPICFEQNVPSIWNRMVLLGAECFVQVSFESWFGNTYFQKQVAYITRLRAIETRHSVARCSNGGLTFFVDPFGRIYAQAPFRESATIGSLALSSELTFYTRHQNLFTMICLIISVVSGAVILWPGKWNK